MIKLREEKIARGRGERGAVDMLFGERGTIAHTNLLVTLVFSRINGKV